MKNNTHIISRIVSNSIAGELGIQPGDELISVNNTNIQDIFDYQYQINDEYVTLVIRKPDGQEWEFEIEKDYDEDLGIEFSESLMDEYKSCRNKCIFCFIDQLPQGMRDTLYFKDDDSRLSFLQGNYITLTNMQIADIERIVHYHLEPINISIHTTNPELRCKMLNNRFAGDIIDKISILYNGNITMNGQIVCCKNYNDNNELRKTLSDLERYIPTMQSLSVVPFGMTDFRDNLCKIEKFTKEDCIEIISIVEEYQDKFLKKYGTRFVMASDEWYISAGLPIPNADYYEDYKQIENGVGMVRSLIDEVDDYLNVLLNKGLSSKATMNSYPENNDFTKTISNSVSIATGVLVSPYIKQITEKIISLFPNISVSMYTILNDYFGHNITVSGLITGQDLCSQLKCKQLGNYLILPDTMLKSDENIFLDNMLLEDLEKTLQIKTIIVKSDGKSLVDAILGINQN